MSAYNVCCKYLNPLKNSLILEANSMNPDQTAPKGAVWSGSILFANMATKGQKQMREQPTMVVEMVNP